MLEQMYYISFAESRVEDCLQLNFNYQALAYPSYSFCVCWTSAHATKAQHFSSVRASISAYILAVSKSSKQGGYFGDRMVGGKNNLRSIYKQTCILFDYYNCVTVFPLLIQRIWCSYSNLWETSKNYSSIISFSSPAFITFS